MKVVKVCILTYYSFSEVQGGAPLYTYIIAKHLVEKGFDVTVFCRGKSPKNVEFEYEGIKVKQYGKLIFNYTKYCRIIDKNVFYIWEIWRDFVKECKTSDVIHLISSIFFFPFGYMWRRKKKIITSVIEGIPHGETSLAENLFLTYYRWQLKLATKCSDVLVAEDSLKIIGPSGYKDSKFIKKKLNLCMINFVDTTLFHPSAPNERLKSKLDCKSSRNIVVVGSLTQNKAVDIVIRSMYKILKVIPNAKLLIIGVGPNFKSLLLLTKKLNLEKNVMFLGEIKHDKMPMYYALADVIVCPSRSEGGVPNTTKEPMAMEKAVVISEACDIANILGSAVVKFKVGDVEGLSNAVTNLLQNQNISKEIGKKGREVILKIASRETCYKTLDDIYDGVII